MSTVTTNFTTDASRIFNTVSVNLWYYYKQLSPYIQKMLATNSWSVKLAQLNIGETTISGKLVVEFGEEVSVLLESFTGELGSSAGRLLILTGGLFVDIIPGGLPRASFMELTDVAVDRSSVIVPPYFEKTSPIILSNTDDVSMIAGDGFLQIDLNVDQLSRETAEVKEPEGLKAVNGIQPTDGQLFIRGAGEVAVDVEALE